MTEKNVNENENVTVGKRNFDSIEDCVVWVLGRRKRLATRFLLRVCRRNGITGPYGERLTRPTLEAALDGMKRTNVIKTLHDGPKRQVWVLA